MEQTSNKGLLIGIVAAAVLIFAGLVWAIVAAPSGTGPVSSENVSFTDSSSTPFVGLENSPVVVRMYSDFQCPACKSAEPGVRAAIEKYKDRVKFVWKDFPLITVHQNARAAANVARCSQDQGKFWEMHDLLYSKQEIWSPQPDPRASFEEYAAQLKLDVTSFATCLDAKKNDDKIMADEAEGTKNGVNATPTFYVNKTQYVGMPAEQWSTVLDAALASASSSK